MTCFDTFEIKRLHWWYLKVGMDSADQALYPQEIFMMVGIILSRPQTTKYGISPSAIIVFFSSIVKVNVLWSMLTVWLL